MFTAVSGKNMRMPRKRYGGWRKLAGRASSLKATLLSLELQSMPFLTSPTSWTFRLLTCNSESRVPKHVRYLDSRSATEGSRPALLRMTLSLIADLLPV